jgi:hypothetical protein
VKSPFIWPGCASHWKWYDAPAWSVIENVESPVPATDDMTFTPGPVRWQLWFADMSWMVSV